MQQTLAAAGANRPDGISDQERVAAYLERAITEFEWNATTPRSLQDLSMEYPDLVFAAAAKHLDSEVESPAHRFLCALLLRQESLFERLTNPACLSFERALRLFKRLLAIDPTLDFRMARTLPGRSDSTHDKVLSHRQAARALDILDQTSPGQRLISVIGRLLHSGNSGISAKAAMFVGRRANNPAWTAKQLDREDNRVRANALEAAWGAKSDAAVRLLVDCVKDANNRVAGNALIGLHMAGWPDVTERAETMSRAVDPGRRSTAAWAMGKIGNPAFIDRLTVLLRDESPLVRSTAIRSLVEIGRAEHQRLSAIEAVPESVAVSPQPAEPAVVAQPVADDAETIAPEEPYELSLNGSSFRVAKRR